MRAVLYAIRREKGWEPRWTVDWETDRRYWADAGYRAGALAGWQAAGRSPAVAVPSPDALMRLRSPLPLGIAESAVAFASREDLGREWRDAERILHRSIRSAVRASCPENEPPFEVEEWVPERLGDNTEAQGSRTAGNTIGAMAGKAAERLRGCSLLQAEALVALEPYLPAGDAASLLPVLQLAALLGGVRLAASVALSGTEGGRMGSRRSGVRCSRCGSGEEGLRRMPCASCGSLRCAYCETCLTMGRSRECGLLAWGVPDGAHPVRHRPALSGSETAERWKLSPAQSEAASVALAYLLRERRDPGQGNGWRRYMANFVGLSDSAEISIRPRRESGTFLLWAVTGAGKTEMIFPLLDAVLAAGGRAAVATPRRDVVLELAPRLAAAFPHVRLTVLYGGSRDRFEPGDLTLATTHQLMRFREAFDLVVVDEVDAFPYHNDSALHYAAARSRSRRGTTVLLSATPPPEIQRLAKKGRLPHARVPVRHHRRPLPVPGKMTVPPLFRWSARGRVPNNLLKEIRTSLERGAQLFLFVPYIRQIDPLLRCLRSQAATLGIEPAAIAGTSSQDPERESRVSSFRQREIRILVTTTILERGVTIPRSDVFVLDADKPLFDASSLVQMAGRAGRSADDPDGTVRFAAPSWTNAQRNACRQIREMNRYAKRNGYLAD